MSLALAVSAGDEQADARCEGDAGVAIADELIAPVEKKVAKACAGAGKIGRVERREGVAELMARGGVDGPFLGEGVRPLARDVVAEEGVDVLHDPVFLIVGLFEKKTVVGDPLGRWRGLRGRGRGGRLLRKASQRAEESEKN